MKIINSMILALLSFNAFSENITLTATQELNENTLVTLGIPFAEGEFTESNSVMIFDASGEEIQSFVKPTMYWYSDNHIKSSVRAIKVQFNAAKFSNTTNYSFDIGESSLPSLAEQEQSESWVNVPNKSDHPIVIATLASAYIENSNILPPFRSGEDNAFFNAQMEWVDDLNYSTSTLGNWLFDRTSALYKGCVRTESASCYQEAFMSYQFWMNSLKRDGDLSTCKGGSLMSGTPKNCDSKYAYTEQIKIHLALTGDDSQHDTSFVKDIAALKDEHYYQAKVDDPFDVEGEAFTERAAGLILLTQLNAYQLTGSEAIYNDVLKRIDVLYEHQSQNPDGFNVTGSWRHSWAKHEALSYPGDGVKDDKRFSPWMTENIVDSLWLAYQVTGDTRIPSMISKAARSLIDWGFSDSRGYIDKYGKSLEDYSGKKWSHGCNTTGDTVLYSASSVASLDALITTQGKDGFYSDTHTPEAVFMLALGYYFETDDEYKELIRLRLDNLLKGFINEACGKISSTHRMFSWSNRSNFIGTLNWVSEQDPNILIEAEDLLAISGDIVEDFTVGQNSDLWQSTENLAIIDSGAVGALKGMQLLNQFDLKDFYQLDLLFESSSSSTLSTGLIVGHQGQEFYSVRIKSGQWGGIYIYEHANANDISGKVVASRTSLPNELNVLNKLSVKVHGSLIVVEINQSEVLSFQTNRIVLSGSFGVLVVTPSSAMVMKKLAFTNGKPKILKSFSESFESQVSDSWGAGTNWVIANGHLVAKNASKFLMHDSIKSDDYVVASEIILDTSLGNLTLGLVFGESECYYYAVKVKGGPWGGMFVYKLDKNYSWDVSGVYIQSKSLELPFGQSLKLKVAVNERKVFLSIAGESMELMLEDDVTLGHPGYVSLNAKGAASVTKFSLVYYE